MNRRWRSWMPAVAITAAVGAGALVVPLTANAAADLPDLSAAEVLELAANHSVDTLSGTIDQTSDLGLPDLSLISGAGGTDAGGGVTPGGDPSMGAESRNNAPATPETAVLELLTAPHTARVYLDGPFQARIQVLDEMAERNIILNDGELWFYDSEDKSAVHTTLPDSGLAGKDPGYLLNVPTPDQLAALFLQKVDPTTDVSVGADRTVAGRPAYQLILTPRTEETLVESITVDVDGETGLPLAVSVAATGTNIPAFSIAYTEISLEPPAPKMFDFTPPAGAIITEVPENRDHAEGYGSDSAKPGPPGGSTEESSEDLFEPTVTGGGWDSVIEFPAGDFEAGGTEVTGLIDQLSTPVDGGQVLQTRLLNILLTDDGRVLVGSVPVERLLAVASGE